jgi:putative membrane protein
MVRMLISLAIQLAANAIGLIVAAAVLDGMSIDGAAFVIALLIFTAVEVIAAPLIREMAIRHANALMGGTALVTTFVGLLITDLVSDGLNIDGVWTWILAMLIVWLASLLAALFLPMIFLKQAAERRRGDAQTAH